MVTRLVKTVLCKPYLTRRLTGLFFLVPGSNTETRYTNSYRPGTRLHRWNNSGWDFNWRPCSGWYLFLLSKKENLHARQQRNAEVRDRAPFENALQTYAEVAQTSVQTERKFTLLIQYYHENSMIKSKRNRPINNNNNNNNNNYYYNYTG